MSIHQRFLLTIFVYAFIGTTHAAQISNTGGDFHYIPYFSVSKGQEELIKLSNTSDLSVIARVTFRRATDSLSILIFDVYLSPKDIWTGKISPTDDTYSNAKIVTKDNNCTLPHKKSWKVASDGAFSVAFDSSRFGSNVTLRSENVLSGFRSNLIKSIHEGYVTVTVMGVSDLNTNTEGTIVYFSQLVNGVPRDCEQIERDFYNKFIKTVSEFTSPQNVLEVTAILVDPSKGISVDIPVTAIANTFSRNGINLLTISSVDSPNESSATSYSPIIANDGNAYNLTFDSPARAFSSVLMKESIFGNFDNTLGNSSSWIVALPTKRRLMNLGTATQPFTDSIVYLSTKFGREEQNTASTPSSIALPYSINVLTFGNNPLASEVNVKTYPEFDKGWLQLGFINAAPVTATDFINNSPITLNGMPIIKFEYNENTNISNGGGSQASKQNAAEYDSDNGMLNVPLVHAFGKWFNAKFKNQGDYKFTLESATQK